MNDYEYVYTKLRKEFGAPCNFSHTACVTVINLPPDPQLQKEYKHQNPGHIGFDCTPELSCHSVNTERVVMESRTQSHVEGGWPKEIDPKEPQETTKWRKRLEKDPQLTASVPVICRSMKDILNLNTCIDMFEEYFAGQSSDLEMSPFECSTVGLFKVKDSVGMMAGVTNINWHPDGVSRFLSCCASLSYSHEEADVSGRHQSTYIWDVEAASSPISDLSSNWPLVTAQFYSRNPDLIAGGDKAGRIEFFDLRQGPKSVGISGFEESHHFSVFDLTWLQSKTHSELVSTSPDGRVCWWDTRALSRPTEACVLPDGFGGTRIEWQQEAGPTKYLVGTEEGVCMNLTKKPKKPVEMGGWFGAEDHGGQQPHHGPVYSIKRNSFHPKYFLTVGDWTMKIWVEELKSPLFQSAPVPARFSSGGWSPSRPGVLFATRLDGVVDFYDVNYQMNQIALSHKIGDIALSASAPNGTGQLIAIGDVNGHVSLIKVCDELTMPSSSAEKGVVGSILEREQRRERNLDAVKKVAKIPRTPVDLSIASLYKGQTTIDQQSFIARERNWSAEPSDSSL